MSSHLKCFVAPVLCGLIMFAHSSALAQSDTSTDKETKSRESEVFGEDTSTTSNDTPSKTPEKSPDDDEKREEKKDEDKKDNAKKGVENKSEDVKKGPTTPSTRDDSIFGGDTTVTPSTNTTQDKLDELDKQLERAEDKLALGGFLFMQAAYNITENGSLETNRLRAPQLLDVFLDARPSPRVRAYFRGRLTYDFTIQEQAQTSQQDPDMQMIPDVQALGQNASKTDVQLDQLWVKFDINRSVYLTVGRQRIRWGAGRFWNPTDFLNATQIDPLALFDVRLGVDLIKLHLPVESKSWNFYAIGILGDTQNLKDLGGALRGEFVFGTNEITMSFAARRQTFQGPNALPPIYEPTQTWPKTSVPLRLGADYSGALWKFDIKFEGALTKGLAQPFYRGAFNIEDLSTLQLPEDFSREDEWIFQGVAGAEISIKYNDEDSVLIGGEYFYNQAGYNNAELYLWTLLQGGFRPLYLGRHYGALGVILPSPGSWNDSTFSLSTIGNLSDKSFLTRLDYSMRARSGLSINAFAMKYFGDYGEFRFKVDVPSLGPTPAVSVPAPSWDFGAGLRLSF